MHLCNNRPVSRGPRWICTSHFSMLLRFRYISFMLGKNKYLRTRFQNTWWSLMITLNRTLKRPSRVLILHAMPISCPTQEMHLWHLLTAKHPSMSGTTCIIPCTSKRNPKSFCIKEAMNCRNKSICLFCTPLDFPEQSFLTSDDRADSWPLCNIIIPALHEEVKTQKVPTAWPRRQDIKLQGCLFDLPSHPQKPCNHLLSWDLTLGDL